MAAASTDSAPPARYVFGPRETRGVLLGLRGPQLGLIVGGLTAFVAGVAAGGVVALLGVAAVAAASALAVVPVAGRTAEQWAPVAAGFGVQRLTGQRRFRSGPWHPSDQHHDREIAAALGLPGALTGLRLLTAPVPGGRAVGVVKDPAAGTYTAVLAVRGSTFALLETADADRRVAAWGALLAGLARDGSAVTRLQWVERTLPDSGDALTRYWAQAGRGDRAAAARSYLQLIAAAGPVTQTHETYLALAIDGRRARRTVRQAGGGDRGALAVLLRELAALEERLGQASLEVVGWLPPRTLAGALRAAYEPGFAPALARRADVGLGDGVTPAAAGPVAADNHWASYRTDDGWHATYWVSEWPRLGVGADFLAPLLLHTSCRRTVALVAEPVSPRRAARAVAAARTAELANQAMRDRVGQLTTARQQREADAVNDREHELVAGHAEFRFSGFVTVTAHSQDELEEACGQVEHAAHAALLEIRRLYGQQDQAFAFTLPLARGLR